MIMNKSMIKMDIESSKNLEYLIKILTRLSLPYENQLNSIPDSHKWNLPNDIVSDWESYEHVVDSLFKAKIIMKDIKEKFEVLVNNFDEVSLHAEKFEEVIWNLEGLKNHEFWQKQRKLANELLVALRITIPDNSGYK